MTAWTIWQAGAAMFADNPNASLTGMILLFFGAILLGMPVSFGMLLATIAYLELTDVAPVVAVPQSMVDGTGNFVLLALPFFIFAGLIMERGGISVRLVRFAMALIGSARGGSAAGDRHNDFPGFGRVRVEGCRRRGRRPGRTRRDEAAGLQGIRGRRGAGRLRRDVGDHTAQHRHAGAGIGDANLDRHAVHRRYPAGCRDRHLPDGADLPAGAAGLVTSTRCRWLAIGSRRSPARSCR